jgi:FkbM family methyltransferase
MPGIKKQVKKWVKKIPVAFTKSQRYDAWTKKIIDSVTTINSNCIDAGTHEGAIFDLFLEHAPKGHHFGFEPIPVLFEGLQKKYASCKNCSIHNIALSNKKGATSFNYVLSNPSYSGIKKRKYDRKKEDDTLIEVQTDLLDDLIPKELPIRFIKIDVEGGEMDVLKGAVRLLGDYHPFLVFEFGIGGSDIYGTTPEEMFAFLSRFNYKVSLLDSFLKKKPSLSQKDFSDQFYEKKNCYFIAH